MTDFGDPERSASEPNMRDGTLGDGRIAVGGAVMREAYSVAVAGFAERLPQVMLKAKAKLKCRVFDFAAF